MKQVLSDIDFDNWEAILLSTLPALLNLFIFIYVKFKFPAHKISNVFSLFLLALVLFQLGDTFLRMSNTLETATLWNLILVVGVMFVMPFGLHFCLLYTEKKKLADSFLVQFLLYAPALIFLILTLLKQDEVTFIHSSFWGWVYKQNAGSIGAMQGYWIGFLGMIMLVMLIRHAGLSPENSNERKRATLIACGFSIPLAQGILTEILLPVLSNGNSIPLASATMTFFSVSIIISLKRYGLFSLEETLKTETILEAMTDVLIILSPDKNILFINKEGEQAFGINNMEKDYYEIRNLFVDEKQFTDFDENLFLPALGGENIHNFITEFVSKSGTKISALISATPIKAKAGKPQVLLLIHNISEHIQTSQQLVLREEQLKDKTDELNAFFYRTTHDLKGPIASIIGLTRLAKKENDLKTAEMCLDKIEISASRLDNILLDFIKVMQIKERVAEPQLINFYKLTDGIVQSIKYSTGHDIVDYKVWIEPNLIFHSDEKLIDSILYNLVANAVNYRKQNGEEDPYVFIQIRNFADGILMKVGDNGVGMKKEIQSKIFNLFFRGNEDSKGTGLGLYILKNALDKLNGRIVVDSEINKGSTFSVFLPDMNSDQKTGSLTVAYSSAS